METDLAVAPGRGFLLSVARGAGEGRAQPRQVRPRVRPRVQGPRIRSPRRSTAEIPAEWLKKLAEKYLTEEEKKQIEAHGRPRQAPGDAAPAPRRAEGPPPGRQEMDRHRRHLAVRRLRLQSRRRAHRPGRQPQLPRREGLGQARVQGPRRRRRARHPQHQDRAAPAAQVRAHRRARRARSRRHHQGHRAQGLSRHPDAARSGTTR